MAEPIQTPQGNGESLHANVRGIGLQIRSVAPIALVVLPIVVAVMLWVALDKISGERKDMLTQFLAAFTTLTTQQREDNREIRQLLEAKDKDARQRYLHGMEVLLRNFLNLRHSLEHPVEERLPIGVLPPAMEQDLQKQLPQP